MSAPADEPGSRAGSPGDPPTPPGSAPRARVELTLLGQSLTLRTTASREYLQRLVAFVEERVTALERGGVNRATALALAALDIADELFRTRDERSHGTDDVRARLDALIDLIESTAPDPPQTP